MSFSVHFFAGYVRVLTSSIRMPISTVKPVFGPLQARKTESRVFNSVMHFSRVVADGLALPVALFSVCGFLILANPSRVEAQTLQARISVTSVAPARIRIDVKFPNATNVLSFRNAYGGVLGLGERIEMPEAINASGESIAVQKLAPGEFQTSENFTRLRYNVNVAEPARPAQMSHV